MKNFIAVFFLFAVLMVACKGKDDDNTPIIDPPTHIPNYFPLTAGSYWVYDWFRVDPLGNETYQNKRDSVYIAGDTLINGSTYAKLTGKALTIPLPAFYRDSSGFLVDEKGQLQFAPLDFSGMVLRSDSIIVNGEPFLVIDYKTEPSDTLISLPIGDFNCVNYNGQVTEYKNGAPWKVRPTPTFFADSVGIVLSSTFFVSSPDCLERRLVHYAIK